LPGRIIISIEGFGSLFRRSHRPVDIARMNEAAMFPAKI